MQLKLTGELLSKARPRHYKGRVLLPAKYRMGKEAAIAEIWLQHKHLVPCTAVEIILIGKHNRKRDLDNTAAFAMDVLVQAGIIPDDSMACITRISAELRHSNDPPYTLITLK